MCSMRVPPFVSTHDLLEDDTDVDLIDLRDDPSAWAPPADAVSPAPARPEPVKQRTWQGRFGEAYVQSLIAD